MIVEKIVAKASEKAQAVQAFMLTQETSSVDFENDRLKSAESSQRTQIDVKVIVDGKVGVSSTTDPQDIDGVVNRALEAAQFGSPAHFELPDPQSLDPVKMCREFYDGIGLPVGHLTVNWLVRRYAKKIVLTGSSRESMLAFWALTCTSPVK